jgi:hypothetical protein
MSEDPKLFDAGDHNLFRYCHNDPIDLTDPMGTQDTALPPGPTHATQAMEMDRAYNFIMGLMQRQFNSAISAGMAGYQASSAWSGGLQTVQQGVGPTVTRTYATKVASSLTAEGVMSAAKSDINRFSDNYDGGPGGIYFDPGRITQGQAHTIYGIPFGPLARVQTTSVSNTSFTFTTMKGHFEAGTITFSAKNIPDGFKFKIQSVARSSSWLNYAAYHYIGKQFQTATWNNFLHNVEAYGSQFSEP